jgi:catechol 2,3-dioxygenase-like lactoylglutathione lyase family enzyme
VDKILGIDHIGIGIRNMDTMKAFYHGLLEFKDIFGEMPEGDHEQIHGLLRMCPTIHSAMQINQKCGGIAVAMFKHVYPVPRPIRKHMRYGDIGITKVSIAVADLNHFHKEFKDKLNFCSEIHTTTIPGWGNHSFLYARDPEGNFIEFIDGKELSIKDKFGGIRWVGIGVTDLERSMEFYQKYLGFEKTVIDIHESFSGNIDDVTGFNQTKVRSCLLANNTGNGMVELSEFIKPRGRSIPFCTNWGDFGFLQMCLLGNDINDIKNMIIDEDLDLILTPQAIADDDPKNTGLAFLYTRDPDGIPIEVMVLPKRIS